MRIRLISHASVIFECKDTYIWTDPWLFSKAFNESWSLLVKPWFDESLLEKISYLWISHEHPDHFNVPTLRSLPKAFKENVTVLFQDNNSEKMFDAFEQFGFRNFIRLPHRKIIELNNDIHVYCYHSGGLDSCLGVMADNKIALNINDAWITSYDCKIILYDIGSVDIILNQFSIADYNGYGKFEKELIKRSQCILENIYQNHIDLDAKITIPFASFIYFSTEDNKFINQYCNTPRDVYRYFDDRSKKTVILYPGDDYRIGDNFNSEENLRKYDEDFSQLQELHYDKISSIQISDIEKAFKLKVNDLYKKYPWIIFLFIKSLKIYMPDLNKTIICSIAFRKLKEVQNTTDPDMIVNSQPLYFAFTQHFGMQTLTISGRIKVEKKYISWITLKIICSLNNAEIYLKPHLFFTYKNIQYILSRFSGGLRQIASIGRLLIPQ